jgi:hypothetical protein
MLYTLIVAPTSTSAQAAIFRPEIEMDGTRTRVLIDQMLVRPVSPALTRTAPDTPTGSAQPGPSSLG